MNKKNLIERMRCLLQEEVEVEDFITGEKKKEIRESRAMLVYREKQIAYENAVIDFASRLARSQDSAAGLIEWTRSGGIYRQRALAAKRDWEGTGYKKDIERAQATIAHILGSSMVKWKRNLEECVEEIEENVMGAFGSSFFPATILPGGFARSPGWMQFKRDDLHLETSHSSSSKRGSASVGFNLGLYSVGGSGGGGVKNEECKFTENRFGIEFEFVSVEISRPAFNPNFFLSRSWRPKDSFIRDYGPLHSDGKENPKGVMIGYPTKALFVRDMVIHSSDIASFMKTKQDDIKAGGSVGYGPFVIGGSYQQENKKGETNYDCDSASIKVDGLQLVAFVSALFPYTANPSPDVKNWI